MLGALLYIHPASPPHLLYSFNNIAKTMKQRIVIRVQLKCQKCRSKALMIAAKSSGVTSVALQGEEKCNQIVVIGEEVDAAGLTSLIRKKVGNASLELVHAVESAE